jgi:hypothetical protein
MDELEFCCRAMGRERRRKRRGIIMGIGWGELIVFTQKLDNNNEEGMG